MSFTKKQSGFTLVEIIVVIAIMGIIGGLATLIIGRTLDSYAALERREELQTSIRLAVERISRELRHALPQSVCVHDGTDCSSGSGTRFYFIPIKDSGRYQDRPGAYPASGGILRDRLPILPLFRDRFDVLSTDGNDGGNNRLNAVAGDWVVVYNPNNNDIYLGPNNIRNQINKINNPTPKDIKNTASTLDDIDHIEFSNNSTFGVPISTNQSFANHSPSRRFHIIDNYQQVTLFYLDGTTLRRRTNNFSNPNATALTDPILLENIDPLNFSFTYTPGSLSRAGLLRINITVIQQGEKIQVIHDAHVYNTP